MPSTTRRAVAKSLSRYTAPTRASKASSSAAARPRPPVASSLAPRRRQASSPISRGEPREKRALGERRAALAQLALAFVGVQLEERFGQDELEHGVAQELEALVVSGRSGWSCR